MRSFEVAFVMRSWSPSLLRSALRRFVGFPPRRVRFVSVKLPAASPR